jgi:hypothetical protein
MREAAPRDGVPREAVMFDDERRLRILGQGELYSQFHPSILPVRRRILIRLSKLFPDRAENTSRRLELSWEHRHRKIPAMAGKRS